MIIYRKSAQKESSQIAKIHLKSFPDFFLTTLGLSFLKTYYKTCSNCKDAISICAVDDDKKTLLGFSVGCYHSKGFNKKLINANLGVYFYQAIILFFTKPLAIVRLFKNLGKSENIINDDGNYAELLSIGVVPNKNGLGIGKELLKKFEFEVKKRGINTITLTTDADFNDNALSFYKKAGYKIFCEFITYPNRKMLKLIKII